jgi:rhodanese-related sulfurtransferase
VEILKKASYVITLVLLLLLASCGNAGYRNVEVGEAKELIDKQEVVVLDVRTPEEFQQGHIPGATLIPVQVLEGSLKELDKDTAYLVVCRSGNRSVQASDILTSNGFKEVYNMTGGMNSWTYEIEQ